MKRKFLTFHFLNILYLILFAHLLFWLLAPRIPYPQILPDQIDFSGIFDLKNTKLFFSSLKSSINVALLVICINLIFAVPLAILLTQHKNRITSLISGLLYLPLLAPVLLPAFGLYEIFIRTNTIGTHLSVAIAQSTLLFPYMLKPIENFLNIRGYHLEHVAADLGEAELNTFLKVTLPDLVPAILFGSFLCFIGSFNDYLVAFLIGDLQISTLSVTLYPLIQSDNRVTSIITILFYVAPLILLVIFSARLKFIAKAGNLYART